MADPTFDPSKPFSVQDAVAPSVTPTTATPTPTKPTRVDDPNGPTRVVMNDKGEVLEIRGNPNYQGRSGGERFRDTYMDSVQNGFGGFAARKILGDGWDFGLLGGPTDESLIGTNEDGAMRSIRLSKWYADNPAANKEVEDLFHQGKNAGEVRDIMYAKMPKSYEERYPDDALAPEYEAQVGRAWNSNRTRIANAQRDLRMTGAMKEEQDPSSWYNPAWLGGTLLGSAGLEDLASPGVGKFAKLGKFAPVASRMTGAALVNAGADAFYQGMDINDGVTNTYSPGQTLFAGLTGAGFQGGLEAAAAGGSKLYKLFRSRLRGAGPDGKLLEGVKLPDGLVIEMMPDGNARVTHEKEGMDFTFSKDYFDNEGAWMVPVINDLNGKGADFRISFDKGGKPVIIQNDRAAIEPFMPDDLKAEAGNYSRVYSGDETYLTNNKRTSDTRVYNGDETYLGNNSRTSDTRVGGEDPAAPKPVEEAPPEEIVVIGRPRKKKKKKGEDEPLPAEPVAEPVAPAPVVADPAKGFEGEAPAFLGERVNPDAPLPVRPDEPTPATPTEPVAPDAIAPKPEEAPATATPEAPEFDGDVVTRLTAAINDAGELSKKQAALLTKTRSEKLKAVASARSTSSGEAGFNAELGSLKGETPKVDFEGVRGKFKPEEIDGLFDSIKNNPNLSLFDSVNARAGLRKLLDGTVPTKSEIELLGKVFPPDFVKAALRHRSTTSKIADFAGNALNLPRSLMSTADLSAPLRQGVFLVGRKEFYKAVPTMFKEFRDAFIKNDSIPTPQRGENWQSSGSMLMDEIQARPTYDLMEQAGLAISKPHSIDLSAREEQFMSQWAERVPGNNAVSKGYNNTVGRVVQASEAAFSGFLNKLRADTFDDLVRKSADAGIDFRTNPKALKDIASFINAATGRGSLGQLNQAAPVLSGIFFSPRLMASRIQMLSPHFYANPDVSPVVRREAQKALLSFGAITATILGLAKAGGADVETDPRSSDFGKIKVDNTRYDIFGGFQQYAVLATRLATNETKTLKGDVKTLGEGYGSRTRLSVGGDFLANKASPVAGYIRDYLRGTNPVGEKFDPADNAVKLFIPLFLQDLYEGYEEEGVTGAAKTAPALFGVGVQNYGGPAPKFDPKAPSTEEALPAGAEIVEPGFDPKAEATAEPLPADAAPVDAGFDPNKPFDTTTTANLGAVGILKGMGLTPTDEGVRSYEDQERYYTTSNGAAKPGTSSHEFGNAVDVKVPKGVKPSDIVAAFQAKGYKGVTIITKRHGTGPHWHIQWESAGE